MEERKSKKSWEWLIIVLVVIAMLIWFVVTLGSAELKDKTVEDKKEPGLYDDIDFGKIPKDLDQAIKEIEVRLEKIKLRREKIMKSLNQILVVIKAIFLFGWIGANVIIAHYGSVNFGVNEFVLWNQAIIICILFFLFILSEKFSSVYLAFTALKLLIVKKVKIELDINSGAEKMLNHKLYLLEAIRDCHPGILYMRS